MMIRKHCHLFQRKTRKINENLIMHVIGMFYMVAFIKFIA